MNSVDISIKFVVIILMVIEFIDTIINLFVIV